MGGSIVIEERAADTYRIDENTTAELPIAHLESTTPSPARPSSMPGDTVGSVFGEADPASAPFATPQTQAW